MNKKRRTLLHVAVAVALVALGTFGMNRLTASKPQLERRGPTTVAAPMVRTIQVRTGPQTVHIFGEGTVQPLSEIDLVPQVGGKVVYLSPSLVNGGRFRQGERLLRIDPVDYELAVTIAGANVKEAESRLHLAEEEAAAARHEWHLHNGGSPKGNSNPPPLVAKEPQLAAAQAKLEADRAELRKALLNLERTELTAPFDGRVSEENIDLGQYVSTGTSLATLYSTEAAEIVVPLEDEKAFWFHVPGFTPGSGPGSPATVRARIAGNAQTWTGEVVRTEGKLDERTRLINVVVRVEKPYATKHPLAVGLFVTVDIQGRTLTNAALIPRSALHEDNQVWVVDENGRLRFRTVDVARLQGDEALVQAGLDNGQRLVITPLKAVTDGMAVRTIPGQEDRRS